MTEHLPLTVIPAERVNQRPIFEINPTANLVHRNSREPQENQIVRRYSAIVVGTVIASFNVWVADTDHFQYKLILSNLVIFFFSLIVVILAEYRWLPQFLISILLQT